MGVQAVAIRHPFQFAGAVALLLFGLGLVHLA